LDQTRLHALEDQCIQECAPPCTAACPIHVDVRGLADAIARGDYSSARKTFVKSAPFPRILAAICDQPCQAACNRRELGGSIDAAGLERASLRFGADPVARPGPLPKKNKLVAVVGGGLSGLTAALDLARKGYKVTVFEAQSRLGGRVRDVSVGLLPPEEIDADLAVLRTLGATIQLNTRIGQDLPFEQLAAEFDAIYLGTGMGEIPGIPFARESLDPLTYATAQPQVFAGGSLLGAHSPVFSISDGRRAAASIDRFLQKVSLTAGRTNEGSYTTRLFTHLAGVAPSTAAPPADPVVGFDRMEAGGEAGRCLRCECLECVKVCEYLAHYGSYPKKYTREIYNNLTMIGRVRSANQMINSCALCGLCVEVCPERFDMGVLCRESRQTMVRTGKMPVSAHDFALRDMAFSNSPAFDLALAPTDGASCEYAFFPGCQLSGSDPAHVERVYADLRARLPGTGLLLRCCGAPADWAGEVDLFQASLDEFKARWQDLGKPRVILACSSCYRVFQANLPDIPIISLWEIFDTMGIPSARASDLPARLTLHDPCATRHERGIQDSARSILARLGVQVDELPLSREWTECCGYGGLVWLAHPELARDIVRRRTQEDPGEYVTYCAMCRDFFARSGKPTRHLLDLIYGRAEAPAAARHLGYSERHENRARLKRDLLRAYGRSGEPTLDAEQAIRLLVAPAVREVLDQRMILDDDLREVIAHAERTKEKFVSPAGRCLACHRPASVTYWVEYAPEGDGFRVLNAYSHRMEIARSAAQ
jgi:glutamate synthase (NADPH) small chain